MSYVSFEWAGEPHASESIKYVDGVEVTRNLVPSPSMDDNIAFDTTRDAEVTQVDGPDGLHGLLTQTGDRTPYVGFLNLDAEPGQWFAWAVSFAWGDDIGRLRLQSQYRDDDGQTVESPQIAVDYSDMPAGGRATFVSQAPEGVGYARMYLWFYLEGVFTPPPIGSTIYVDYFSASTADTEAEALAQVETYFDGDTPTYFTPPTFLVRQNGEWQPALPRVFTGGAYHQIPMKQHSDGGYE